MRHPESHHASSQEWRSSRKRLVGVLLLSLGLNLWGIHWGLPQRWHPDEIVTRAEQMFDQRTLNHRYFAYGALHYYQVMAVAVLPVRVAQKFLGRLDTTFEEGVTTLLARALSAVMAVGIVLMVYLIGAALFSRGAGLWGALLLTLSMGFVNLAHFATTEIPSIFWFTLSCLMSSYALRRRALRWYLLAGLFAGLSAAVKYIGGLSLIPLMVAHALDGRGRPWRWLLAGVAMSWVGFVVGNAVMLIAFPEFLEGFIKESAYNAARGEGRLPRAFIPLITQRLVQTLGAPLWLFSLAGLSYSLRLARARESRAAVLLIWAMALPYYLVMGMQHEVGMRYIVPIVPVLLVLVGKLVADRLTEPDRLGRMLVVGIMVIVLGYSAIYTVAADLSFVRDSRYLAREWVLRHVPAGASIEMTLYGPELPAARYRVALRPMTSASLEQEASAAERKTSHMLQRWLYTLGSRRSRSTEQVAGAYTTWYEAEIQRHREAAKTFNLGLQGLEERRPDYLILSSLYTRPLSRKVGPDVPERQLLTPLMAGKIPYRKAAELRYRFLPGVEPLLEFVNGTITIFQRQDLVDGAAAVRPGKPSDRSGT